LSVVKNVPVPETLIPTTTAQSASWETTVKLPQWVENDRKVLRFFGYFKESVVESSSENHRIRKIILYYYLEDDSMHLAEPRQDNSGIPQGVFIKRHKITREDGSFVTPSDLSVGSTVTLYGRTCFLVDCDSFTRQYYQDKLSIEQGPTLSYPDDPIDAYRATFNINKAKMASTAATAIASSENGPSSLTRRVNDFKSYIEARLGKPSHLLEGDRLRQFLENNRRVLRFWCVWDDRTILYGDRRPYVLHYFLEDDSVEILEVNENNSGKDPFPVFLKRGRLPKSPPHVNEMLTTKLKKEQAYTPGDLRIGSYINVLNRDFYLHDCDTFTRVWYQDNLGFAEDELAPIDVREPIIPKPRPALPAYNGYGTIEDSLQNCLSLMPKPPRRDLHKLMNKDKIILRFVVRIVNTDTHKHSDTDLARRFILSYYMMDDSILIFEQPVRNSGISGGKFLERQRVFKPNSEEVYTYMDLYVGGLIMVFNRAFELMEADDYTLTYMENYKDIFIMSDVEMMVRSLRAQVLGREEDIRAAFVAADTNGTGTIGPEALEKAVLDVGLKCTRHQLLSLQRRLDKEKEGVVRIEELLNILGIAAA